MKTKFVLCPVCEKHHTCKITKVNKDEGYTRYFCAISGTYFIGDYQEEERMKGELT